MQGRNANSLLNCMKESKRDYMKPNRKKKFKFKREKLSSVSIRVQGKCLRAHTVFAFYRSSHQVPHTLDKSMYDPA